jgi:hypothetical protein
MELKKTPLNIEIRLILYVSLMIQAIYKKE